MTYARALMRRSMLLALTPACLLAPAAAAPAATQEELTAPVAGRAPDSDAPPAW